jgi:hypothetical protein
METNEPTKRQRIQQQLGIAFCALIVVVIPLAFGVVVLLKLIP